MKQAQVTLTAYKDNGKWDETIRYESEFPIIRVISLISEAKLMVNNRNFTIDVIGRNSSWRRLVINK